MLLKHKIFLKTLKLSKYGLILCKTMKITLFFPLEFVI